MRDFFCKDVAVEEVIDFGGVPVFNAAMVDTAIVRLAKSAPKASFPSSVLTRSFSIQDSLSDYVHDNAVPFVRPVDGAASWVVMSPERFRIKRTVEQQGVPLEKWQIAIYRGILTGYNEAFYINTKQRDEFTDEDPRCADLIVPLLRGRYVDKFVTQWDEAEDEKWMINSHNGVKELGIPPVNLRVEYPVLWNHLVAYEEKLDARLDKGDHWSNLRNCAYIHDFQKAKVIYPEITKRLGFFLDKGNGFYPNNKAFILTSEAESLAYLTAALNSTLFRCCFKDDFPNLGEDRRELRKIFMDKIPIKKPTAQQAALFEALVPMVQAIKAESQKSEKPELKSVAVFIEEVIDACVMEGYFADDMAEHRLGIMAHVTPLLQNFDAAAPPAQQVELAQQFYAEANDSKHPIRNILIRLPLDSPDLLAVIQREGAV